MTSFRSEPARSATALNARRAVLLVLLVFCAACHAAPRPAATPDRVTDAVQSLQRDIEGLTSRPGLEQTSWGISVRSLQNDQPLYLQSSRRLLLPASTLKIVTLAAAASRLGWEWTFETQVLALGTIDAGVLNGDLLVVGGGDPTIDNWDGAATALFAEWASTIQAAGIRRVTGRVIADDNAFDEQPWGAGWAWDDLSASFAAAIGALQFNQNSARLTFAPGHSEGDSVSITIDPERSGLNVRSAVVTGSAHAASPLILQRVPGSAILSVQGTVPAGTERFSRTVSVPNPTLYFAEALRDGLAEAGVLIEGAVVDIDDLADPPARHGAIALLTHSSAPLSSVAATMMKLSQNLYAETLLKQMGSGFDGGSGTVAGGQRAVWSVLTPWGIDRTALQMVDGSGLSRYNLATADALVTVLTHVYQDDRLRGGFEASLPVAGRDGTLERRMIGTPAENNAHAKTGSFTNVRSLAGYVRTRDGEPLAFCIMANNFGQGSQPIDQAIDAIVIRLANFTRAAGR